VGAIVVPVLFGAVPTTRRWIKATLWPVSAKFGEHSPTEPRVGEDVSMAVVVESQSSEDRYVRIAVEPEAAYHGFFDPHRLVDSDSSNLIPEPVKLEPFGRRPVIVRLKLKGPFDPSRNRARIRFTVYSQSLGGRERRAGGRRCRLSIADNQSSVVPPPTAAASPVTSPPAS
jgi:hypothetical protein